MTAGEDEVRRRYEMVRQQVNSKIYWGTEDAEVLEWLARKCGITGGAGEAMLVEGHAAKRAAVRKRAILWLIFSGLAVAVVGAFYAVQILGGVYYVGTGPAAVAVFGVVSLGTFLRSLWQLLTGRMRGAVD